MFVFEQVFEQVLIVPVVLEVPVVPNMLLTLALVLNMIWVYFVVSMTGRVERFLGKGGIYIIRKFFGIILLAISVRLFMANISLLLESFHQ